MKVALIHYWLVGMRGGERVLEALCELFPTADIYTHVYRPEGVSDTIRAHQVTETFIGRLPRAHRWYPAYLPLMPLALETLDLTAYDLVISSESGPAKGVITAPGSVHLCYCHSPMRYVWDMQADYFSRLSPFMRALAYPLAHYLRLWDFASAARVDQFIANSAFVAARIRKYYRREAQIIHAPVDITRFSPGEGSGEYYLAVGQLVRYKRFDLAVEAFNRLERPLWIVGEGEQMADLKRLARPTIRFLGAMHGAELAAVYRQCRALIFPGIEDFGIVPLEAMASGRPVIAYARGGALETVQDGATGLLFYEQTPESIMKAVRHFEENPARFDPEALHRHAAGFDTGLFKARISALIERVIAEYR
jgi:glycosyltransferase involved in cell wall biosynthesis